MIGIIVAFNADRVIGVNGGIPWTFKGDMRRFKEVTMGSTVIMGRKTWESIPAKFRPLAGRRNLIVSQTIIAGGDAVTCAEPWMAQDIAAKMGGNVWFIGGARIYAEAMQYADVIDVTWVPWETPAWAQPSEDWLDGPVLSVEMKEGKIVAFPPIDEAVFAPGPIEPHPYEPDLKLQRFERRKLSM